MAGFYSGIFLVIPSVVSSNCVPNIVLNRPVVILNIRFLPILLEGFHSYMNRRIKTTFSNIKIKVFSVNLVNLVVNLY